MGTPTPKNKIIKVVVMFSIIAIVIYLSFKLRNDERDDILENKIVVTGTVSNVGWKTIDVSYEINGKIYVYTENIPFKSVVVGEQFYTLVNSEKLERALVYDNKPILDTIKYAFSIVTPNNISEPIADNDYLDYDYTVNGRKYSRIQKYYGDVPIPQNLDKLKVKYRIDRPEIGYLVE
ncbi:unnamed protein product [Rotaria socialis]|uniref:Uncharacterized protein n=1 Tax=Rotaria socialis TaxID=392032 RepID=A0A818JN71_9BILA|nr:unnamed protein product [Rotaria socialis]